MSRGNSRQLAFDRMTAESRQIGPVVAAAVADIASVVGRPEILLKLFLSIFNFE